jgi:hypothetical protein
MAQDSSKEFGYSHKPPVFAAQIFERFQTDLFLASSSAGKHLVGHLAG